MGKSNVAVRSAYALGMSRKLVERCFSELETRGMCCLEDVVPAPYLADCREQVKRYIAVQGERYFSIYQPCRAPDSAFARLAASADFIGLLRALSIRAAGEDCARDVAVHDVLRVVAGPTGAGRSLMFHYDATVITALVPLFIPEGRPDEAGDLIALPNLRRIRRSAVVNALEKALVQNTLSRKALALLLRRDEQRHVQRLKPGNIYLFWGYRTLHANLPMKPDGLRSTLLFHFGDPHKGSPVTKAVLRLRKMREQRGLAK